MLEEWVDDERKGDKEDAKIRVKERKMKERGKEKKYLRDTIDSDAIKRRRRSQNRSKILKPILNAKLFDFFPNW